MGAKQQQKSATGPERSSPNYKTFDQLDGSHPWQKHVPEGYILYPVRRLPQGQVAYFNYSLAKEMGLIPPDHEHKLNKELEEKILDTFCLRIINEYDQENNALFPSSQVKSNKYMATRYLQLQHSDKTGKTSGDGRCIWNGIFHYNGTTWDVSSRGTGVTALAPGVVEAGRYLPSGNNEVGYGGGLAEIDELFGSTIMAEILHNNGINTERTLAVIDLGDGNGIGVRASKNLLRPAHLFRFLKQNEWDALKRSTDFLIERQYQNNEWSFSKKHPDKYDLMLEEICESFAQFAAQLDRDYIFAWLDWDGDNVLATAGIIDYGSVRQFGLRHDQYRYDDVERFSTNLNEQKGKAKLTVQVFAQLVDYLKTGEKKPLSRFNRSAILKKYEKHFNYYLLDRFLYQIGYIRKQREHLLQNHRRSVKNLYENFSYLERKKTYKKLQKLADGINRPPIFNLRVVLRELPHFLWENFDNFNSSYQSPKALFSEMLADFASRRDSKLGSRLKKRIMRLQTQYKSVLKKAFATTNNEQEMLKQLADRSAFINQENRVTGNALINIVNEIFEYKREGMTYHSIQKAIDNFIASQCFHPETADTLESPKLHGARKSKELMRSMMTLVHGHREDI